MNRLINAHKILRIGRWAFRWSQLTYIDIRCSSVLTIQQETFKGCCNLVHFLGDVTTVKNGSFENCHNLRTFQVPELNSIGYSAFKNCWNLESFPRIGFDVKRIPDSAFENCKSLKNLTIFSQILGVNAFANCYSLFLFINTIKPIFFEYRSAYCVANVICSSKIRGDTPKMHTLHLLFEDERPDPMPDRVYCASGKFLSK